MKDQNKVEVSLRSQDLSKPEDYWFSNRNTEDELREWWQQTGRGNFDQYFDERDALDRFRAHQNRRKQVASPL
jgi:hypothetical protein